VFALADDVGADDSANVPRPLCRLLLDLAKPQVHAAPPAPPAPASSAIAYRKHSSKWTSGVFSDFYMFQGSSRCVDCLSSYLNRSDLNWGDALPLCF
jgi:hypothetical protein